MPNGATDVTRGEFQLLKDIVDRTQLRLDVIDDHGTRGIGVLQTQIIDLVKDVTDLNTRFDTHATVHQKEQDDRVKGRRWMAGAVIAALGSLAAILTVVVEILINTH